MEKEFIETAALFMGNGYGIGKYKDGFLFMKNASDNHLLYLTENQFSVLENGEKKAVFESASISTSIIEKYFSLKADKKSVINWFAPVNIKIICEDAETTRKNIIYFFYPTVQVSFSQELLPNTIIIHDRTVSTEQIDDLKQIALNRGLSNRIEFWSKIKLVTMSDKMGNLATKGCFDKAMAAYEKDMNECCGGDCPDCKE